MNWKKYTIQLLGRWQPWHKGHTELFKKAHKQTRKAQRSNTKLRMYT